MAANTSSTTRTLVSAFISGSFPSGRSALTYCLPANPTRLPGGPPRAGGWLAARSMTAKRSARFDVLPDVLPWGLSSRRGQEGNLSVRIHRPGTGGHRQGGEAVDAGGVALGAVGRQGGVVLAPCPLVVQVALPGVVVERDRVPARVGDALDLDHHHGTSAATGREPRRQLAPLLFTGQDDPSLPIEAQDPRRAG